MGVPKRVKMPERSGRRAPHGAQCMELFDLMPRPATGAYSFSEQRLQVFFVALGFLALFLVDADRVELEQMRRHVLMF